MEFLKILNIMGEHLFKSKHTVFYSHTGHEIIDANVYIILARRWASLGARACPHLKIKKLG